MACKVSTTCGGRLGAGHPELACSLRHAVEDLGLALPSEEPHLGAPVTIPGRTLPGVADLRIPGMRSPTLTLNVAS